MLLAVPDTRPLNSASGRTATRSLSTASIFRLHEKAEQDAAAQDITVSCGCRKPSRASATVTTGLTVAQALSDMGGPGAREPPESATCTA